MSENKVDKWNEIIEKNWKGIGMPRNLAKSPNDTMYYFNVKYPDNPLNEADWTRFLNEVRNHPVSPALIGKTIAMFYFTKETSAFITLLNGSHFCKAVATQISRTNYTNLPIREEKTVTDVHDKWGFVELNKKECYELTYRTNDAVCSYIHDTYEDTYEAYLECHKTYPYGDGVITKHTINNTLTGTSICTRTCSIAP